MTPTGAEVQTRTETMTLHEELQTIDGVGPATADKIVRIVDEHREQKNPYIPEEYDAPDAVAEAIDQARRGNEGAVIAYLEGLQE